MTKTLRLFDNNGKSVVLEVTRITTLEELAQGRANGIPVTLANITTNTRPNVQWAYVQWAHEMKFPHGGKK